MITTMRVVLLIILVAVLPAFSLAGDHEGTLVLKVDGKEVKFDLAGGSYGTPDNDEGDYFAIGGEKAVLQGKFDLNGDGKSDQKDRLPVTEDDVVKPAKALNKAHPLVPSGTPGQDEDNYVELPGLGKMQVLKGSTLTLTRFRVLDGVNDRWSGTVKLLLKGDKGQKTVTGIFECGTGAE